MDLTMVKAAMKGESTLYEAFPVHEVRFADDANNVNYPEEADGATKEYVGTMGKYDNVEQKDTSETRG
jgi:hypothetical protein